jgi:hypothetical protein
MSQAESANTTNLPTVMPPAPDGGSSRRPFLRGAPAAAAAAPAGGTVVNAVAIGMAKAVEVDPIFGLIEKHKATCDAARAFSARWGDMSPSDPEYDVIKERFDDAYNGERKVLVLLLTCQPTTLAGIVAALEHVGQTDWVFGNDSEDTVLTDASECNIEEAKVFPKHLAAALRNIIARGQA